MKIQAIIFDMDGVLLDSEPLLDHYYAKVLHSLGVRVLPDVFNEVRGTDTKSFWAYFVERYNIKKPNEIFLNKVRQGYLHYLNTVHVKPTVGVMQCIKFCQKNDISLAIASSSSPKRLQGTLKLLNLLEDFPVIVSGRDINNGKPAPDIFLHAAKLLKKPASSCIVIEDSKNGIKAANASGIFCIGFTGNAHATEDVSQADLILSSFNDITQFIKTHL